MVDLHTHTDASDGTDSPRELIDNAIAAGLEALAITDHDTLYGYEQALPYARERGFDLVCGIELSTKFQGKTVHLLSYFLHGRPTPDFCNWLVEQQEKRRDRNRRLIRRLNEVGLDITLAEVEALGKTMTGRPHFAKVLLRKGYVKTTQEAFDTYIAEDGKAFVQRDEVPLEEALTRVAPAGGIPVMAHPIRLGKRRHDEEEAMIGEAAGLGLQGLEVIHSDHSPEDVVRYRGYAAKYSLLETGGSDYHGSIKPDVTLGQGREGNVQVPLQFLEGLRRAAIAVS